MAARWPQPSVWPAKNKLLTPGRTKGRISFGAPKRAERVFVANAEAGTDMGREGTVDSTQLRSYIRDRMR